MDILTYVNKRRKNYCQQAKIVKDYSIFDFNYVPDKPLIREEVKKIIDAIIQYERTGIPSNQVVFGSRGSGKTLMVKYLSKLLNFNSGVTILYVNVRYYSSSFKILAHLLKKSFRGSSLSELYELFRMSYPSKTIIILDEIHLWSPKEKQRELLYFLSRDRRNYLLIMLSNDPRFLSDLDQSVRSTLQPELIHFKNYHALEISKILKSRAKIGLAQNPGIVGNQIAALTVKDANSDVRVAIKALFYWATSENQNVDECFENARKDIYVDLIADLSDTNLLIMKAVTLVKDNFAKKVFTAYNEISKVNGEHPCSYVHFYNQLSYLQSLGLIMLLSTNVNRTYANRISVLCNPEIIREVYKIRFQ